MRAVASFLKAAKWPDSSIKIKNSGTENEKSRSISVVVYKTLRRKASL